MIPALWLIADPADAHRPGLSYARVEGGAVHLTFAAPELAVLADTTGLRARVAVDGAPCTLGEPTTRPVEGDGVEISASLACPAGAAWTLEAPYLADFAPGHRHYVEAFGSSVAVLDAGQPTASFPGPEGGGSAAGTVAVDFFGLGVEHILTGTDHLAFLLGLLLAARGLREMAWVVSGFTVAHSITLALAALDIVQISPEIVEPAIALSIAYVAVENFWEPPPRRRVAITFLLGLMHGFGFAGILAELGLPAGQLAVALVSFNVGVEAGQLLVVLPLLPLLLWLRRYESWRVTGVRALSVLLALAGIAWFVTRILEIG